MVHVWIGQCNESEKITKIGLETQILNQGISFLNILNFFFWKEKFKIKWVFIINILKVFIIVLKTGPDRSVRPVQPGVSSVRLKAPKPVNNRSTTGKPAKNRGWTGNYKKNGSIPGSVFKTMVFIVLLILCMDLIFFNKKRLNFHFIFNVPKPLICSIDTQVKEICINIPLPSELSIK